MTTAIYAHTANDPNGHAITRQLNACHDLAERLGWTVDSHYVDLEASGYKLNSRPGFAALLRDIAADKIAAVVVFHVDRLTRHPRELEQFLDLVDEHNVMVRMPFPDTFNMATPEGRYAFRLLCAMAGYEADTTDGGTS